MFKFIAVGLGLLSSALVSAADVKLEEKLEKAMAAETRPAAELSRDRNRQPLETLQFLGLKDSMKVVELIPGGGWYTRLLAPVLAEKGELIVALGTSRVKNNIQGSKGFENNIKIVAEDSKMYRPKDARLYTLEMDSLGVTNADMVLTFRNYHNFDEVGRAAMNKGALDALKSGGIYGVVDHTRRHMESDSRENRRRFDPVKAIKEIQAAGFEFVDFSDMHARADDELRYEVGRKTVTGNTDRWTLKFRKP